MKNREASKVNTAAVSLPSHERKMPISVCLMVVALLASLLVWSPDELSSVALAQEEGRQTEPTIPSDAVNLHHNCSDYGTEIDVNYGIGRSRPYGNDRYIVYRVTERTDLRVYSTREADDCNSYNDGDIVITAKDVIICDYRRFSFLSNDRDCNPPSYTLRSYIIGTHVDAPADVDEYDISSYIYSMREGRISGLRDRYASCEYDPSSSTISIIDTSYSVTSACIIGGKEYYLGPIFQISPLKFRKSRITSKTNNLSPGKWWVKLCHRDEYPNYSDHCSDVEGATRTINFETRKFGDDIHIRWLGVTSNPAGRTGFPNTLYLRDRHGTTELSCPATRSTPRNGYLNFICTGHTNKLDSDFIVIGSNSNYAARGGEISKREIPTVQVIRMEVTQGLQDWNNSVTLVKGKRTAVRVFVENTEETHVNFSGLLKATVISENGKRELGSLISVNPSNSIIARTDIISRRYDINSSLNFILPEKWTDLEDGEVLELKFNYSGLDEKNIQCDEITYETVEDKEKIKSTENRCVETARFVSVTPPNIVMVPVSVANESTIDDDDGIPPHRGVIMEQISRIESLMPFPSSNFMGTDYIEIFDTEIGPIERTNFEYDNEDENDDNDLEDTDLIVLNNKLIELREKSEDKYNSAIFLGLMNDSSLYRVIGRGSFKNDIASWFTSTGSRSKYGYSRNVGSHELAHALDRPHTVRRVFRNGVEKREGVCGETASESAEVYPYFHNFGTENNEFWRPVLGPLPHIDNNFDFNDEVWGLDTRYVNPEALENFSYENSQVKRIRITDEEYINLSVVNPYKIFSLMSYCNPQKNFKLDTRDNSQAIWIDRHNYDAILQNPKGTGGVTLASGSSASAIKVDSHYFSGSLLLLSDGTVSKITVDPVHSRPRRPVSVSSGEYNLELRDANGIVLRSVPFSVDESILDPSDGYGILDTTIFVNFSLTVSDPPDYSKFVITHSGKSLIEINRSPDAPVLSVNGPIEGQRFTAGDTVTLSWSASDSDKDKLDYLVYYSTDGGSSYNLISLPRSDTTKSFQFNNLDGTEQARFAVSASDGTRSTFVETPVFAVDNHAPIVDIISPAFSSVFAESQGFLLDGWAYDKEDGFISSSSFSWSSNIDGSLGTGDIIILSAADLTAGDHTITLTVTDSNGATASATTNITISRQNQLPTTNDDIIRVALDDRALIDVLANDIDVEGDFKLETLAIFDLPFLGAAEIATNELGKSVIAYTAGSVGTDYFTYLICDGVDRCDIAQVTINITTDGCTILGTEEDDTLRGTSGNDVICGLGGNDTIYGSGGNDIIRAGRGDDTIYGQAGNDTIYGGYGNDNILGHRGDDIIYGGFGNEEIWGGGGDDTIWGGYGADEIRGEADNDTLYGEDGPDLIHGGRGDDTIYGGPGDDTIRGNQGADTIYSGPGSNTLLGTAPEDTIIRNFYGG